MFVRRTLFLLVLCVGFFSSGLAEALSSNQIAKNIRKLQRDFTDTVKCSFKKEGCTGKQKAAIAITTAAIFAALAKLSFGGSAGPTPPPEQLSVPASTRSTRTTGKTRSNMSGGSPAIPAVSPPVASSLTPRRSAVSPQVKSKVVRVPVDQQTGNTCGFHSISNAYCIANSMATGIHNRQFSSATESRYNSDPGEWRKMVDLARKDFGLTDVEVLTDMLGADEIANIMTQEFPNFNYYIYSPNLTNSFGQQLDTQGLRRAINDFKNDSNRTVLPLIIQITVPEGPHWVVDAIKKENNALVHYLADYYNRDIRSNPVIANIIKMTQ